MFCKRNIEVKAKLHDIEGALDSLRGDSNSREEVFLQEDYFFNVPCGRLKLRVVEGKYDEAKLIHYERQDARGPRLCHYTTAPCPYGKKTLEVLQKAVGVKGYVKKVRHLFFIGRTRIHIDEVEGLGNFIEIEVVLTEDQLLSEAESIASSLLKEFNVTDADLIPCAYVDMLHSK